MPGARLTSEGVAEPEMEPPARIGRAPVDGTSHVETDQPERRVEARTGTGTDLERAHGDIADRGVDVAGIEESHTS